MKRSNETNGRDEESPSLKKRLTIENAMDVEEKSDSSAIQDVTETEALRALWEQCDDDTPWLDFQSSVNRVKRDPMSQAITHLDLSGCNINGVLSIHIGVFTHLQRLNISRNRLTSLPAEIGNLGSLHFLRLDSNRLTSLPHEFERLTQLEELDLSNNQLTSLPSEIGNLTSLLRLTIFRNELTSLPHEIGNLNSLQYLTLTGNQLTSIPSEIIKGWTLLKELNLRGNRLTSLPAEIGVLTSLKCLSLSHNHLASLPVEIGNLVSLKDLLLDHNQLLSIPDEIGNLTSLNRLELFHNRLTSLPREMKALASLQYLWLADNCLLSLTSIRPIRSALKKVYFNNQRMPTHIPSHYPLAVDCDAKYDFTLSFRIEDCLDPGLINIQTSVVAPRWRYLDAVLTSGMEEAQSSRCLDLTEYFSPQLGRCIVNLFYGRMAKVDVLTPQDGHDFLKHAEQFYLDTREVEDGGGGAFHLLSLFCRKITFLSFNRNEQCP